MLVEIQDKIRHGVFDMAAYFPDAELANGSETFGHYAALWLASLSELADSTRQDYAKILRRVWTPAFETRPIRSIRHSEVVQVLSEAAVTGKTRNNVLIPVRQVFEFALDDDAIDKNPAERIKNSRPQTKMPDPFELHEAERIIADMAKHEPAPIANYFAAAFYGGFRPSEQIALTWQDLDHNARTVRVQRAVVRGKAKDTTKTNTVRDVELNDRAWAAFMAQQPHTALANKQIFNNPAINAPWTDIQSQNKIWARSLRRLKIRYRVPYQTRHTFATLALLAGANPSWVARQLGHATTAMLFKVYSKWIDGSDKSRERNKVNALFGDSSPQSHQEKGGST